MNNKLILQLSLFGLAMAVATVYWIPSNIEWIFWLIIFLIIAYFVAKNASGKYFLHGFLISLVNCVWITSAHILLYDTYIANHQQELKMTVDMGGFFAEHPRRAMLIMGPAIGIISGIVLGLFCFIASKLVKKN